MGRVSGSYESVVRGVSEQNAQSRRSGQHWAQVNMVSDPVRGLARRHGSILQHEILKTGGENYSAVLSDTMSSRVFPFFVGGVEYDLIVRTETSLGDDLTFAVCFNKETRQFITVENDASALYLAVRTAGVSAVANVGRYLYLAGNGIIPTASTLDKWGVSSNQQKIVGWVRGGAYARTFKVTLTRSDNSTVTASYMTKAASYPGTLDTSDILTGDPDYQKLVNDRTNAYNTAVTQWIGEAAQDITPENIASKLRDALIAAGVSSGHVSIDGGYVIVNNVLYKEISLDDSGDQSLVRNVGNVIKNIDLVSSKHFVGKVLKVEPESDSAGDPIYLQAYAKDGVSVGFVDVVWREAAGFEITPTSVFLFATVQDNTLYIAGSAGSLSSLSDVPDVPNFQPNKVGDAGSTPAPDFIGKAISYMGVFQDRLLIGSGGNVFCSRPGDYLNWFRGSVLTIEDDDPASGFALGSEDDTIRYGALYDRSLLLYGERFQYVISGRTQITPKAFSIPVVSAYKDAVDAAPRASGNFVYYSKQSGKPGKEVSSIHQVQPGVVADVSDSYEASQQLDTYLAGKPVEILEMTSPNMILFRTDRDRKQVFTYSYLDNPNTNERLYDSWSKWAWAEQVGQMMGISSHKADLLFYMVKAGVDRNGTPGTWFSCEQFVRDSGLSDYPYLDSLRPVGSYHAPDANTYLQDELADPTSAAIAIGRGPDEQFLGDSLDNIVRFEGQYGSLAGDTYVGFNYDAYTTPTNPFARDRNGQAILGGRLTLNKTEIALTDTGGLKVTVDARGQTRDSLNFTGRILAQPINMIGRQPVVTANVTAVIGGEVRECTYTLAAIRWLPLTINAIEWQGQLFFNTKRA